MSEQPLINKPVEFEDRQSHLKAQNDLLALKMLHEPDFMKRVPVLSALREVDLDNLGQVHSFEPVDSIEPGMRENALHEGLESTSSGLNETTMHALSAEVLDRVREHLDALLPDLIASTLEEVLRDWSRGKN